MMCSGNDHESCGGENAIEVYQNASFVQCYDGYHFIGSFAYVYLQCLFLFTFPMLCGTARMTGAIPVMTPACFQAE
ncbi:hypothetical protein BDP27DRAFT_1329886 [Rhodocollybia butyracea]|uniref:Uncharacterized protein n=1 Tax=Rhodocollybia butyracea TaxID=206335 RepID=A0A9P5PQS8_9AGAR|nr:hypothetical protein BDP27DRAFT_1329886 [Rhodocollybia butyracea]